MKVSFLKRGIPAAAALLLAMAANNSNAAVISYDFTNTSTSLVSGTLLSAPPVGSKFANARFTDISAGVVQLVLSTEASLASSLYATQWFFNLGGNATLNSVAVNGTPLGTWSTLPASASTSTGPNASSFASGGSFDFRLDFSAERPRELNAGSTITYTLTGQNGFDANSFLTANNNGLFAAVRVEGGNVNSYFRTLNTDGLGTPAAVNVPEPVTMSIMGVGLLGMALSRRRKPLAK